MHNGARSIFSFYPQDPRALQKSQASRIGAERVLARSPRENPLLLLYVCFLSFLRCPRGRRGGPKIGAGQRLKQRGEPRAKRGERDLLRGGAARTNR